MKILIIEDEARAANHLIRLLQKIDASLKPMAIIESVAESIAFLKEVQSIDLIISDIQLSDGLSFEIYKQINIACPIIFTTAYDQYAIKAFDTNGIDYLLKPIEEERLHQAIEKVKKLAPKIDIQQLLNLNLNQKQQVFKSRFMIKAGDRIKSIPSDEIKAFYSQDKATFLLTKNERSYAIDYSLDELLAMIDTSIYFKTNRKTIVSIDAFDSILAWSNSRLKLSIKGLDEPVIVAREKVQEFKKWLDR